MKDIDVKIQELSQTLPNGFREEFVERVKECHNVNARDIEMWVDESLHNLEFADMFKAKYLRGMDMSGVYEHAVDEMYTFMSYAMAGSPSELRTIFEEYGNGKHSDNWR